MLLRHLCGCSDPEAPVESVNMQNDQYEVTKQILVCCIVLPDTLRYLPSQQEHHRLPVVTEWDWECCDNRDWRCRRVSAVRSRHEFCYPEES